MVVKQTPKEEGVQAIVVGAESLGLTVGNDQQGGHIGLGWQRRHLLKIVDESTCVRLEYETWPQTDLTTVRVGTEFTPLLATTPQQTETSLSNQSGLNQ